MTQAILCVLLALSHTVDAWTTYLVIKAGGRETSPFGVLQFLQKLLPGEWTWLITTKIAIVGLQWSALYATWPDDWIIAITCTGYVIHGWVIGHNLDEYQKQKQINQRR